MAHLLLEGAGNLKEELLFANSVGAKEEECALLIEGLCPHSIQHKAQHLCQNPPMIMSPVVMPSMPSAWDELCMCRALSCQSTVAAYGIYTHNHDLPAECLYQAICKMQFKLCRQTMCSVTCMPVPHECITDVVCLDGDSKPLRLSTPRMHDKAGSNTPE